MKEMEYVQELRQDDVNAPSVRPRLTGFLAYREIIPLILSGSSYEDLGKIEEAKIRFR